MRLRHKIHTYIVPFSCQAALLFLNVNYAEDFDVLSCEEVSRFVNVNRDVVPRTDETPYATKEFSCGLEEDKRPEWFRQVDANTNGIIELAEFDKDLAKSANVIELLKTLETNNGVLPFQCHPSNPFCHQ